MRRCTPWFLLVAGALLVTGCDNDSGRTATPPLASNCGDGALTFVDDAAEGGDVVFAQRDGSLRWLAADAHVHDDGCEPPDLQLERLLPAARAAGLRIMSLLLWQGDLENRARGFTGRDRAISTPELIVHDDVEVSGLPASATGHLMLLGLEPPLDPVLWTARSSAAIVERMRSHRPELLIGMAHAGWPDPDGLSFPAVPGAPVELPVLAARGDLDFIAFELALPKQPEHLDWVDLSTWVRLQNSGFRLPLLAASDYPCGNKTPGNTRSYVLIDGQPTYRKYLDAIRAGRVTMAVYGSDRLDLRIGAARIGDEIRTGPKVTLHIGSCLATEDDIRVMVNGKPAATVRVPSGPQVRAVELTLEESAWIHLRAHRAMTNAIYVIVDGAPIPRVTGDLCYFIDWIGRIQREGNLDLGSDRAVASAAYEQARAIFVDRLPSKNDRECRS